MARPRTQEAGRRVLMANDSCSIPGRHKGDGPITLIKWETRVEEGHWIAEKYPQLFEPLYIHFPVIEAATAAPGEVRG